MYVGAEAYDKIGHKLRKYMHVLTIWSCANNDPDDS